MMTSDEFKRIRRTVNDMKRILREIDEQGSLDTDKERTLTAALREKAMEVERMTSDVLNRV